MANFAKSLLNKSLILSKGNIGNLCISLNQDALQFNFKEILKLTREEYHN